MPRMASSHMPSAPCSLDAESCLFSGVGLEGSLDHAFQGALRVIGSSYGVG
jgi:hypothetical protein